MFRSLVSLAALFTLVTPALAMPPPATRVFEQWTASCNNLGACVALGTAGDGQDLVYLRLAREAGAEAAASFKLVIALPDGAKGPFDVFRLDAVTGGAKTRLAPVPAKPAPDDASTIVATIAPGAPTLALIAAIRDATMLEVAVGSQTDTIDLKGLSAALRFIDDRQGRVGGATALVAKGMTPIGQVPSAPAVPAVTPASAGSVVEVDKPIVTDALLAKPGDVCDADTVKEHADVKAWRVAPDRVLVALPCQGGAYNFQVALYVTDAAGTPVEAVALPRPPGIGMDDTPANILTNGDFDPKTMELSEFAKGRGLGDCGSLATWVWTGSAFALLNASVLDACPGALSDDWPNVFTAVKK